jgi:hypothetical protein
MHIRAYIKRGLFNNQLVREANFFLQNFYQKKKIKIKTFLLHRTWMYVKSMRFVWIQNICC